MVTLAMWPGNQLTTDDGPCANDVRMLPSAVSEWSGVHRYRQKAITLHTPQNAAAMPPINFESIYRV